MHPKMVRSFSLPSTMDSKRNIAQRATPRNCPFYHRHKMGSDLLSKVGEQDLTCHLCWDDLVAVLENSEFSHPKLVSQESFLMNHSSDKIKEFISEDSGLPNSKTKFSRNSFTHFTWETNFRLYGRFARRRPKGYTELREGSDPTGRRERRGDRSRISFGSNPHRTQPRKGRTHRCSPLSETPFGKSGNGPEWPKRDFSKLSVFISSIFPY